jgi:uncharacterized protein (DUF433 family)
MEYRDVINTGEDGKARVRDLNVLVDHVMLRLVQLRDEAAVLAEFSDLTPADLSACVAFSSDRIINVKDIRAENPSVEIWKYLRFFLDGPWTAELIHGLQNIPLNNPEKNIKKQTQQIAF